MPCSHRCGCILLFLFVVCCVTVVRTMEGEQFDTELFIDEVEKRRCIWDMECEEYKNRALKKSAWQEIVEIFSEQNSTTEMKIALGKYTVCFIKYNINTRYTLYKIFL